MIPRIPATGPAAEAVCAAFGLVAYAAAGFTAAFSIASLYAARRFSRRAEAAPRPPLPPVTVLKPIKGTDPDMYRNLASFLEQDHPAFQVLFCLQNPDDPALPLLKKLRQDFPGADIEIVISKNRIGYNPKVNNLSNAYGFAKHEVLVISDSDVRVQRDFLRRAVAPLADPSVGLLTCFYRSTGAQGLPATLEALSVNAQFLPQALVAGMLGGMRFAMGAAMIVRRSAFEAAGGLPALSEHLADDFILGKAVAAAGYRVEFSSLVVDSIPARSTVSQQLSHLVRWSRTIRVCNPSGYVGTLLLHGGPLLLLHAAFGGGWKPLAGFCALEAWRAAALGWMHRSYLGHPKVFRELAWLPVGDVLQFGAWLAGLRSRTVLWRGETYLITTGGRLVPRRRKSAAVPATAV